MSRREQVLKFRAEGLSLRVIARRVGLSPARVGQILRPPARVRLCRCGCGRPVSVPRVQYLPGCHPARRAKRPYRNDLTGREFGGLVALRPVPERLGGQIVWLCRCECGREAAVRRSDLIAGNTRSCGRDCPAKHRRFSGLRRLCDLAERAGWTAAELIARIRGDVLRDAGDDDGHPCHTRPATANH